MVAVRRLGTVFVVSVCMALGACQGNDSGLSGRDGLTALVRIKPEAPGAHCPAGGTAIASGIDKNGDGVLSDAEVSGETTYVCNGVAVPEAAADAPGASPATVISSGAEPAGEHCKAGGQALSWGPDDNGDGVLQKEEVTGTTYVCNGERGAAAADTLVSVDAEPAGSRCAAGGSAIKTGLDANDDGILQPSEVTSTSYVCSGTAGQVSLVRTVDEAVGANCTHGGRKLLSGIDTSGDGYLQEGEASSVSYVCNGAPGTTGSGHQSVFKLVEAPVASCSQGGVQIQIGLDLNDNTVLDSGEATSTANVCNGTPGAPGPSGLTSLVNVTAVEPGATCPAGGQEIASGYDANNDGVLQKTEATNTQVVCDGLDGDAGAAGHNALVAVVPEQAGANCSAGGQRIQSGLDRDDSGVLEQPEVTSTRYVCDGGETALRVTAAMAGGVCKLGGVRIDTGLDQNANGTLEDGEVQRTQYACNAWAASVGTGVSHSCALMTNGSSNAGGPSGATSWVVCWGDNEFGQLGDGTTGNRRTPAAVVGLSNVVKLSVGAHHACALGQTGIVSCWGRNNQGQLGDGSIKNSNRPVAVMNVTGAVDVAAGGTSMTGMGGVSLGYGHSCAVLGTGSVVCWGDNSSGQLGDPSMTSSSTAVSVSVSATTKLTDIRAVAAGGSHSCAVTYQGSVTCWGMNANGQLGDGTTTSRAFANASVAAAIGASLSGVESLALGGIHSCARLGGDGLVRCWGGNTNRQVDGASIDRTRAVPAGSGDSTMTIGAGDRHTCATLSDGRSECWGANSSGQIGSGTSGASSLPTSVYNLAGAVCIDGGADHTCAVTTAGQVWCWGRNYSGQLGDGTPADPRLLPVQAAIAVGP